MLLLKFWSSQAALLRLLLHVSRLQCTLTVGKKENGPKFRISYFTIWPKPHVLENKVEGSIEMCREEKGRGQLD
jgi:hypothetical protein